MAATPPPTEAPALHAANVHDISEEGSDMTRDIYVALFRDKQRRSARSLPDVSEILYEDIGRASDIAQPGGFRRDHVIVSSGDVGESPPKYAKRSFLKQLSSASIRTTYDDFIYANLDYGMSEEDFVNDGTNEPLLWRSKQGVGDFAEQRVKKEHGASLKKTIFIILKSFIGSGILFLPKAFQNGGMLFSVCGLCVSALMSTYCMLRLTECANVITEREGPGTTISYGRVGARAFGRAGRVAVNISLVLSQLGFCCSYLIFVEKNIGDIITHVFKTDGNSVVSASWTLILLQIPLYTPLSWVRRIEYFAITNLFADVLIIFGLFYIIYYSISTMVTHDERYASAHWENFNPKSWALFLGTAVYVFEGIGLILPIYDAMDASVKHHFPAILTSTIMFLVPFFSLFAGVVYAAFGNLTESVVTLNLPDASKSSATVAVQVTYSIALVLTYPLMLYPVITILEGYLFRSIRIKGFWKWQKNAFRFALVCLTAFISYFGKEQLDNFVALIGGFCSVPLAFIYPCVFHSRLVNNGHVGNTIVMLIGIFTMVFASYQAISTWN
ncbi:TPA: hypothetical protein N0F65_001489 [Lagenidium giganteum]|uniref:Amino acid transporter transmembrane domain-containing protein n=1 Tax=Lagenidium giganteum TaxID=4803 RepID=A0AAV2Z2N0_9STRA|nr:TPA: hypothetical protein N0F65_001489 [Lagenidium giganteum]